MAPTVKIATGGITTDPFTTGSYTPSANGCTVLLVAQTGSANGEAQPTISIASGLAGQASFGSPKAGQAGGASTIAGRVWVSKNGSSPTAGTLTVDFVSAPTGATVIVLDYPSTDFDADTAFPLVGGASIAPSTTTTNLSITAGITPQLAARTTLFACNRNNGNSALTVGTTFSAAGGALISGTDIHSATTPYATAAVFEATNTQGTTLDASFAQNVANMLVSYAIQPSSTTEAILVRENTASPTASSSWSVTVTTPAVGQTLIATFWIPDNTMSISSVSGVGATWTRVSSQASTTTGGILEVWIGTGTSGSGTTLTVTPSASTAGLAHVATFKNLNGTAGTPVKANNGGSTSTGPMDSGSYTPVAGQMVMTFHGWSANAGGTPSSTGHPFGVGELSSVGGTYKIRPFWTIAPDTTAVKVTNTINSAASWCAITVGFGVGAVAGTVTTSGSGTATFGQGPVGTIGTVATSGSGTATFAGTPATIGALATSGSGLAGFAGVDFSAPVPLAMTLNGMTSTATSGDLDLDARAAAGDAVYAVATQATTGAVLDSATLARWDVLHGPDGLTGQSVYLLRTRLTATDISNGDISIRWNVAGRNSTFAYRVPAISADIYQPNETSIGFSSNSASTTPMTAGTTTVNDSDILILAAAEVTSGTGADIGFGAVTGGPWTDDGNHASAFASGVNVSTGGAHSRQATATTTGGGTVGSSPSAVTIFEYTIAMRRQGIFLATLATSGSGTASFAGTPSTSDVLTTSGSGTATFVAFPSIQRNLGTSGSGTLTWTSQVPGPVQTLGTSGSGTASFVAGSFIGTAAFSGSGTLTFAPTYLRGLPTSGSGTTTFTGAPGGIGTLVTSGSGLLTFAPAVPHVDRLLDTFSTGTLTWNVGVLAVTGSLLTSGTGTFTYTFVAHIRQDLDLSATMLPDRWSTAILDRWTATLVPDRWTVTMLEDR